MQQGAVFIAVRHGSYNNNEDLSPSGEEQMKMVAQKVKEISGGRVPVALLCSTAPRAFQGGTIIAEELCIPEERRIYHECFWDDNRHHGDRCEAKKLINENFREGEILIAISHLDFVPSITSHVASKFGHEGRFDNSNYGQGWLINEEGAFQFPQ